MSDMWEGFTRNEDGELVLDIYAEPPVDEPESTMDETDEEYLDDEFDEDEEKHTYATIDCGGDCGACVALIVDNNIISGPPFHPNCKCTLSMSDIETADYHASHLHQDVAPNRNVDTRDVKWLKKALIKLGYYTPNARAGESGKNINPYPNDQLFEAIDNFRKAKKIKEQGAVKPGHWTEIKINEELKEAEKAMTETKDTKDMTTDEKFEQAYNKLKEPEGEYTDGKSQVSDQPTNMGITQSTLDVYAEQHPEKDFPSDVQDLAPSQAKEIYKCMYWDNTKIPQIQNARIRNAIFDMGVMSGPTIPTKTLQQTLNDVFDANLPITGHLGNQTIKTINSIPESRIDEFMNTLIENRLQSLQKMKNWPTAKGGWTKRTMAY